MKGKVLTPWLCAVLALIMAVGMALPAVEFKAQAAVSDTIDPGETYYYDLADGEYYVVGGGMNPSTQGTSLTVNGAAFTSGNTLSKPGDYTIVNRYQDRAGNWVELTQQIVLYQRGDAHADGKYNVLDLVAMKRHEQGITLPSKAGQMAVEAYVDKADASVMRDFLLTDQGETALKVLEEALPDTTGLTFNSGSKNVMPIGGYEGPADKTNATDNNGAMKDYLTDEIYGWVKDAGINLILSSGNQTSTPEITTQKYLSLAEKYNMRAFVGPSYLFSDESGGGGVTQTNLEQLLREYSGYSSMAGFTLQDEPDGAVYPTINRDETKDVEESQALAEMLSAYPNLTGFTNLFPYWKELGTEAQFEAYLEEYFTEYGDGADHLCFDYYVFSEGIETGGRSKAEYFKNLAIVKKVADKHGVPFWSTIQAGNYVTGKKQKDDWFSNLIGTAEKAYMTQGLTSWNVNTSLAYGAKGIAYYPLIQPYSYSQVSSGSPNYNRNGIIGANGAQTDHYTFVQKANQQIAAVDEVLMNATHKGFMASGLAKTESGVTNLTGTALSSVSSNKSAGVFVGCFDYYGKDAYYVVNYDYSNSANITLTFNSDYALSVTVDAALNSATTSGNAYTLTLTAGNAALVLVNGEADKVDNTAVDSAIAAIDAIPAAPDATGYYEAVVAARTAYNALTKVQKAQISDEKLNEFNAHLEKTRSYETVAAMIDALPNTVTISGFNDIDKANAAYEALGDWSVLVSAAQKTKLENRLQTRLGTTTLIDAATGRLDNPSIDKGYTVGTESDTDGCTMWVQKDRRRCQSLQAQTPICCGWSPAGQRWSCPTMWQSHRVSLLKSAA